MCTPNVRVRPVFLGDVTAGTYTISWDPPSSTTTTVYPLAAGDIAAAIRQGRPVHVVGFSTAYTCVAVLGGTAIPALVEISGANGLDPLVVTGDIVTPCRMRLSDPAGLTLVVAGAVSQIVNGLVPLMMYVEIDLDPPAHGTPGAAPCGGG